jgi:hypothetical protein
MNELWIEWAGDNSKFGIVNSIAAAIIVALIVKLYRVLAPFLKKVSGTIFNYIVYRFMKRAVMEQTRLVVSGDYVKISAYFAKQKALLNFYLFLATITVLFGMNYLNHNVEISSAWLITKIVLFLLLLYLALEKLAMILISSYINVRTIKKSIESLSASDESDLETIILEYNELELDVATAVHKDLINDHVGLAVRTAETLPKGCKFKVSELFDNSEWLNIAGKNRKIIDRDFRKLVDANYSNILSVYSNSGTTTYIRK